MVAVFNSFNDNIKEVDQYFDLLKKIEEGYTSLSNGTSSYTIDDDLGKILKANSFLILYNLIESTIKSGLWEVFENIKNENLKYSDLLDDLKNLWIDSRLQFDYKTKDRTINQKVLKVIDDVLNNSLDYYTSKRNLKFNAGNLNMKGIHHAFAAHGINATGPHDNITDAFKQTARNRNELAHGDMSFTECGRIYTYKDLRIYKIRIIRYLTECLHNIGKFINEKKYRIAIPA